MKQHQIQIRLHVDSVQHGVVWWADSPDLPGLTATGRTLAEAEFAAKSAAREILGNDAGDDFEFQSSLAVTEQVSQNAARLVQAGSPASSTAGTRHSASAVTSTGA